MQQYDPAPYRLCGLPSAQKNSPPTGAQLHRSASSALCFGGRLSSRVLTVSCSMEAYAYLKPAGPPPPTHPHPTPPSPVTHVVVMLLLVWVLEGETEAGEADMTLHDQRPRKTLTQRRTEQLYVNTRHVATKVFQYCSEFFRDNSSEYLPTSPADSNLAA